MRENFVDTLLSAERGQLIEYLTIYKTFPKSTKSESSIKIDSFIQKVKEHASDLLEWFNDIEYYNDNLSDLQLKELLISKIKKSYKTKDTENLSSIADMLVRDVAKEFEVPFEEKMTAVEIENEIFKKESQDKFNSYKLTLMALSYIAKTEFDKFEKIKNLFKKILRRLNLAKDKNNIFRIIELLLSALIVTKAHKNELNDILRLKKIPLEEILRITAEVKEDKKINFKVLVTAILGMSWILILSNGELKTKQLNAFNSLKEIFGITEKEANEIKTTIEKKFEETKNKILTEFNPKDKILDLNTLKATLPGVACSLLLLSLAKAAGFGLFLFATTTLHAIGLLFGVTFAFSTYTTLTSILGTFTGPIGWIGIPLLVGGGIILYKKFSKPQFLLLQQTIVRCVFFRGGI